MMDRTSAGAHFAALITIIIWGTTFVSTKVLLKGMSAAEILFFRFLAGAAALFLCFKALQRIDQKFKYRQQCVS